MTEEAKEGRKPIIDPTELMTDTSFNPDDIDNAMMSQAGLYSHYAMKASMSQERSDNIKMMRDVMESKIDKEIRDEAVDNSTKITEKMIEGRIRLDTRWMKAQKTYNASKAEAELCKHALEALKQKRDMMVQIGVTMREELKGGLRVKEIEASTTKSKDLRARALEIVNERG